MVRCLRLPKLPLVYEIDTVSQMDETLQQSPLLKAASKKQQVCGQDEALVVEAQRVALLRHYHDVLERHGMLLQGKSIQILPFLGSDGAMSMSSIQDRGLHGIHLMNSRESIAGVPHRRLVIRSPENVYIPQGAVEPSARCLVTWVR